MSKLSFIDKMGILVEVSKSSKLFILVLILLVVLGAVFSTTNRETAKRNKIIYILVTIFIMVLIVATYHAPLGNMFGYMMDNFFIAAFFPNLAIYCAALIIMNIILWISLFDYRTSNSIKMLNIFIYVIMNYLLALVLNVINSNGLDIFTQSSVYGNKQATALIELSSLIFLVWILFLIIYKIILVYLRKDYKPKVKKILVKRTVKKLPENYEPTLIPSIVQSSINTFNKQEETPEIIGMTDIIPQESSKTIGIKDIFSTEKDIKYTSNDNHSLISNLFIDDDEDEDTDFVPLLDQKKEETNTKPIIFEEPVIIESHEVDQDEELRKSFEKLLTLEDYKLLLRMLKEQKEKDKIKEQENIEQERIRKEQIKLEEEQEKLRKEQVKIERKTKAKEDKRYNELLELYRVQ